MKVKLSILLLPLWALLLCPPAWGAFPTVTASTTSFSSSNETTHTVSLATCSSGNLRLQVFGYDGNPTVTWPGGWTEVFALLRGTGAGGGVAIRYRVSTGDEGASISIGTSAGERTAHISLCIGSFNPASAPAGTGLSAGNNATQTGMQELKPAWGADDNLWLAGIVADGNQTVDTWPANYTGNQLQIDAGGTATVTATMMAAIATRSLNSASETPGAYTVTADFSSAGIGFILAIRGAAAATSRIIAED